MFDTLTNGLEGITNIGSQQLWVNIDEGVVHPVSCQFSQSATVTHSSWMDSKSCSSCRLCHPARECRERRRRKLCT